MVCRLPAGLGTAGADVTAAALTGTGLALFSYDSPLMSNLATVTCSIFFPRYDVCFASLVPWFCEGVPLNQGSFERLKPRFFARF